MASILNVDTINNAAGTSALTIDSSWRFTSPARPAFRAFGSSGSWVSFCTG